MIDRRADFALRQRFLLYKTGSGLLGSHLTGLLLVVLVGGLTREASVAGELVSAEFGLDPLVRSVTPCTRAAPAVAVGASGYLAVWNHSKGDHTDATVAAARVSEAGGLLDPFGFAISPQASEQTVSAVAANSNLFLVVWTAPRTATTDWDLLGARVLWDGTIVDATPLSLCALSGALQSSPAVAGNGNNFLVVWRDSRGTAIYGTLVSLEGNVWPTSGFLVGDAANDQYTPAVAALGTKYLVVWQDYRNSATDADIYGARVTGDGLVLDPGGIPICIGLNSQFRPAVAANGTNFLVVWENFDAGGNDIFGARLSPAGVVRDPNGFTIGRAANAQMNAAVTSVGGDFLVTWQDYRNCPTGAFAARIHGTRVRDDGSVVEPDGTPLSATATEQWSPAIAGWGTEFLAVWQDFRNHPDTMLADIYGTRGVSSNNLALDAESSLSGSANAELAPAVAALGTDFLAVWTDTRASATTGTDIYSVRLDGNGEVLDTTAIPVCTATNNQSDAAVAASGTNFLAVWTDGRNTPSNALHGDIYGALVNTTGAVLQSNGFPICTATNDQNGAALALLGTNFLVVWQDARASSPTATRWDIYGARVSASGQVLDPSGIPICTTIPAQTNVAVAANASQALVVWADFRYSGVYPHIFGARIGDDGTVLDPSGLAICTASYFQTSVAVAAEGQGYFVVWCDWRGSPSGPPAIFGAMVSSNGTVSPANGFPIRSAPGSRIAPAVAFNGSDYFVTWQESPSGSTSAFDILGVQVGPEGPLGLGPLLQITRNGFNHTAPAVAAGSDGRFLVLNQGFQSLMRRTVANFVDSEAVPRIDSSVWLPGGPFQFRFRGAVGERYAIEGSTNLAAWRRSWTFTNTQPSTVLSDAAATNSPSCFYRAVLLP